MPLVMLENIEIGKHITVVIVLPLISLIIELSYMRTAGASASVLPEANQGWSGQVDTVYIVLNLFSASLHLLTCVAENNSYCKEHQMLMYEYLLKNKCGCFTARCKLPTENVYIMTTYLSLKLRIHTCVKLL